MRLLHRTPPTCKTKQLVAQHHHPCISNGHAAPSPRLSHPSPQRSTRTHATPPNNDGDDIITRFVGKLFGQQVLEDPEPGGLKRLSDTALQELYPAPLDEFAEPVVCLFVDVCVCKHMGMKRPGICYGTSYTHYIIYTLHHIHTCTYTEYIQVTSCASVPHSGR